MGLRDRLARVRQDWRAAGEAVAPRGPISIQAAEVHNSIVIQTW